MIEDLLRPGHLLAILAVALIFFGPSKLAGLGEGIRNFKTALKEVKSEVAKPQ